MNGRGTEKKHGGQGFALLVSLTLLLSACEAKMHMIASESAPQIAPRSDKAVLVIMRSMAFGAGNYIDNYLDGKMIGQTLGRDFFLTEVTPGMHTLVSRADNTDTARMNFEAGRIYLLLQEISPGWSVTSRYAPLSLDEFRRELLDAEFHAYDTSHPGKDLPPAVLKQAQDAFEREAKRGGHKEILDYKGIRSVK